MTENNSPSIPDQVRKEQQETIKRINKGWQDQHNVLIRELSRQLAKETVDMKSYAQHLVDLLRAVFALPYPRRLVVLACAMPYWIWVADFSIGTLSRGMRASGLHHDGFEPFALSDHVVLAEPRWLPHRLYFQRWIWDALSLTALFGVWFCFVDNCYGDLRPKYTALVVAAFFGPASSLGYMFTNLCDSPLAGDNLEAKRARNILLSVGVWSWVIAFGVAARASTQWDSAAASDTVGAGLRYTGGKWARGAVADWAIDGVGGNFHLNMCYCIELYLAVCCYGYFLWRLLASSNDTSQRGNYKIFKIIGLLAVAFFNVPFALVLMALATSPSQSL